MRSFSKLEKSISANFRAKLSQTEHVPDVIELFRSTMMVVFDEAMPSGNIEPDHVSLDVQSPHHFKIQRELLKNPDFKDIWNNSDLKAITSRFAGSCCKRCLHLERHEEKTNSKIRAV